MKNSGGLDYAIGVMKDFQQKAKNTLPEFPDSDAKRSLFNLMLDYVHREEVLIFSFIILMKYEGLISNFLWKLSENASAFVNPAIFANSLISLSKN